MHRKFSNEQKLKILIEYEQREVSKTSIADKYDIDRKTLREWIEKKDQILAAERTSFKLPGGGRKLSSEECENLLVAKIEDARLQKRRVSQKLILRWGKALVEEKGVTNLRISKGWLFRFLQRNNFTLRKATNMVSLSKEDIVRRAVSFVQTLLGVKSEFAVSDENIFNLDETAIFAEEDSPSTVEKVGAKRVPIGTAGLTGFRITGLLCASACGRKMPPTIIQKGKTESICERNGAVLLTATKSWMNAKCFILWIDFMFPQILTPPNTVLLVFDSAKSHIAKAVKEHLHRRKILFCVIPGGLTGWIQPADLMWFSPLKAAIKHESNIWLESDSTPRTSGRRIKPPNTELMTQWLKTAWGRISPETITTSFRSGFLGQFDALHIAKDLEYGTLFVEKMIAQVEETTTDAIVSEIEMQEEDDFSEIEADLD